MQTVWRPALQGRYVGGKTALLVVRGGLAGCFFKQPIKIAARGKPAALRNLKNRQFPLAQQGFGGLNTQLQNVLQGGAIAIFVKKAPQAGIA